jgi:SagB-type dehydrogenase family enzyme
MEAFDDGPAEETVPRASGAPDEARAAHGWRRRQLLGAAIGTSLLTGAAAMPAGSTALPRPVLDGPESLPGALARRRSVRNYTHDELLLAQLGELLWAAQGISDPRGLRTAPSAGALHPLEVLLLAQRVRELDSGLYRYVPRDHALEAAGEVSADWREMVAGQEWVASAPLVLVITAATARTAARYGTRAARYVAIEAGAVAQNVALRATTLGLGSVIVGAFDDQAARRILRLGSGADPLLLMPVGRPAAG